MGGGWPVPRRFPARDGGLRRLTETVAAREMRDREGRQEFRLM
jgi:hypothetical protein